MSDNVINRNSELFTFFSAPDVPTRRSVYRMLDGTDYAQQTQAVNQIDDQTIDDITRTICYNQSIYNDLCLEKIEYFGLTLGVAMATAVTKVVPMYDFATICIWDDDSKLCYY